MNRKSTKSYTFIHQLTECFLVWSIVCFSYMAAAQLMYHTVFFFGILSGLLLYVIISSLSVLCFGAGRYFRVKETNMPKTVTIIFFIVIFMNLVFVALLYFSQYLRLSIYFFFVVNALQIGLLLPFKFYFARWKQSILLERKTLVIGRAGKQGEIVAAVRSTGACHIMFLDFRDEGLMDCLPFAEVIYVTADIPKRCKDEIVSNSLLFEKDIYIVPEAYEISLRRSVLTQVGDVPVFNIEPYQLSQSQKFLKRLLDMGGAVLGLVLTAPLIVVFSVLIKWEDHGPVFYRQTRSGRDGRPFAVVKFRSMRVDAEHGTGAVFAMEHDPRVTRVGRFMRGTRIDEIPQFFNVLKGDMSLVGPRPERPIFVEAFCKEIPEYKNRLAVKPGITGLAQVLGNYTTTAVNKARFDMVYIQEYSLMLDIKLLLKTVKVIFTKEQATGFVGEEDENGNSFSQMADWSPDGHRQEGKQRKSGWEHWKRFFKTGLVTTCCFLVITASLTLRYVSFAAETFRETMDPSPIVTEVGQCVQLSTFPMAHNRGAVTRTEMGDETAISQSPTEDGIAHPSKEVIAISEETLEKAVAEIEMKDKLETIVMLMTRIRADDIILLEEMSRGGFTVDEKNKAKEIMYRYYNEEEVKMIYQLYVEFVR